MKTLTTALKELGYTHKASTKVNGKQDIFKGEECIGTFSASKAWTLVHMKERQILDFGSGHGIGY